MALDDVLQKRLVAASINTFFSLQREYLNKSLFSTPPEDEKPAIYLIAHNIIERALSDLQASVIKNCGNIISYYLMFSKEDYIPTTNGNRRYSKLVKRLAHSIGEPDGFIEHYVKTEKNETIRIFVIIEYKNGRQIRYGYQQIMKFILGRMFYDIYTGKIDKNRIYNGLLVLDGKNLGKIPAVVIEWYNSGKIYMLSNFWLIKKHKPCELIYKFLVISYDKLKEIIKDHILNTPQDSLLEKLKNNFPEVFYPYSDKKLRGKVSIEEGFIHIYYPYNREHKEIFNTFKENI